MYNLNISAIIPVKTFSAAKTRLGINSQEKKKELCEIMLREIVHTISNSNRIDDIIIVSKDKEILKTSKEKFGTISIVDERECGVNNAVALADKYLLENKYNASIVFPQDIPFMKTQDIDFLFNFFVPPKCALVVPSRKFDGTNALFRMPVDLMETHYDEDSYKIHLSVARKRTEENTSLVFAKRIMLDIDNIEDIKFALEQNEKPDICKEIGDILGKEL